MISHGLADLRSDLRKIKAEAPKRMRATVLAGVRAGNVEAQALARTQNPPGSHSYKYPGTFGAEMHAGRGLFGNVHSGEYGPRAGGQGSLAPILENGSRSGNRPQLNLARSADFIGPIFGREVLDMAAGLFWPGGDR